MAHEIEIAKKAEKKTAALPVHSTGEITQSTPAALFSLADETPPFLSELDKLVSAERLLEIVWEEASRPSLQWIRKETKRRMLPYIRRGRLIFYRPRSVLEWYAQRESRPASMK